MNRRDTHKALKREIVQEERGDGASFVLAKLSWDKEDVRYSLHVALSAYTSGGVQVTDFLGWLGFTLSPCTFVDNGKCYTKWVSADFDLSEFVKSFPKTFSMIKDAQKYLEKCGFFFKQPEGYTYFGGGRPDSRERILEFPGDGHEALINEHMREDTDDLFHYRFTWMKTAQKRGWVIHYKPKRAPLSDEIISTLDFLGLKHFPKCPEYDFEPCYWRSVLFQSGRSEFFDSNAGVVNGWFDAHAQNFLPGLLRLLTANVEIEKTGFSFLFPKQPRREFDKDIEQGIKRPRQSSRGRNEKEFDVVLSFAGAQRGDVEKLANILKKAGFSVFYDRFHSEDLWGKNLVDFFKEIYSERGRFCVIFVSKEYKEREWTNHERQNAQARALRSKGEEYILPIKVDDTELEGMPGTLGYVSIDEGIEEIGKMLVKKLGGQSKQKRAQ